MKVSQLIEVLGRMDPDAEVITHANSHTTDLYNSVTVGVADHYSGKEVVVIGNWDANSPSIWNGIILKGTVWRVLTYGDDAGTLNPYQIQHIPGKRDLFLYPNSIATFGDSWAFVKLPIDQFC